MLTSNARTIKPQILSDLPTTNVTNPQSGKSQQYPTPKLDSFIFFILTPSSNSIPVRKFLIAPPLSTSTSNPPPPLLLHLNSSHPLFLYFPSSSLSLICISIPSHLSLAPRPSKSKSKSKIHNTPTKVTIYLSNQVYRVQPKPNLPLTYHPPNPIQEKVNSTSCIPPHPSHLISSEYFT